jgi:dTMP kinase
VTGRYVAFEGVEGAGKSTVARRIAAMLAERGDDVVLVREPGGTPTGERVRGILLDEGDPVQPWTEALLFAAARSQLVRDVVAPALEAGAWVVSDRSVYSSLAYQGSGRQLGERDVRAVNDIAIGGLWPDVVVLLRVDPALGLARQEVADRIGAEGVEFQQRVSDSFDSLAAGEPGRFIVVDARSPLQDIVEEIWDRLHL